MGQPLDFLEQRQFLGVAQRQGDALGAGAGSAADPVHVALGVVGQFVVDDVRDPLHVDPAGDDIGGHQHFDATAVKGGQGALAGVLALVRVDGIGRDAIAGQLLHQPVGPVLGAGEDQDAADPLLLQQLGQQLAFLLLFDEEYLLLDAARDRGRRRHFDARRVVQHVTGQLDDLRRQRRREEHRLPLFWNSRDNPADVVDEAHVEHPVSLVEDEHFDLVEAHYPLVHQIEQTARGGYQNLGPLAQRTDLRAGRHAAQHHGGAQPKVAAVAAKARVDLQGQFPRRRQNEGAERTIFLGRICRSLAQLL